MKKISLRINGEFQHSFIYSGILFLIDFNKQLLACQWENLLNDSILKLENNSKDIYKYIFNNKKGNNNHKLDFSKISKLDNIKENILNKYIFKDEIININDYPTDINIKNNTLFYTSEKGLLKISFSWNRDECNKNNPRITFPSSKIISLFSDCKIFNFSQSYLDRVLLCAGKNGLLDSKYDKNEEKIKINHEDSSEIWLDSQYFIREGAQYALLSDGSSIKEVVDDETNRYIKILNRINRINKKKKSFNCSQVDVFIENAKLKLQKKFIESNHYILENNLALSNHDFNNPYSYIKERKIGNLNASLIQLDDSLFYYNHIDNTLREIANDFVCWRVFPNATSHFNHCHVIYDDYIEIIGFYK